MYRFSLVTLVLALLMVLAFYFGWFSISTSHVNDDKTNVEFSVDKRKVREDTQQAREKANELGRKTQEEAQDLSRKLHRATEATHPLLELETHSISMERGQSVDLIVRRSGNLTPLQLELTPSPESNLTATGGEFKSGQDSTTVTITAPHEARDGTVRIAADGAAETVTVSIKPQTISF
jgi:hypothetical protein